MAASNTETRLALAEERIAGLRKAEEKMLASLEAIQDDLNSAIKNAEDAMDLHKEHKSKKFQTDMLVKGTMLTSALGVIVLVIDRMVLS